MPRGLRGKPYAGKEPVNVNYVGSPRGLVGNWEAPRSMSKRKAQTVTGVATIYLRASPIAQVVFLFLLFSYINPCPKGPP